MVPALLGLIQQLVRGAYACLLLQQRLGDVLGLGQIVAVAFRRGGLAQLGGQLGGAGQTFQQQGVELAALAVQNHLDGGIVVKGLFVATLTRQGIVDVSQGHNLCGDGDLIPFQAVRVAAAVPALMVPAADGIGHLDQLRLLLEGQLVQNIRTDGGVGFHRLKFFLRQLAGLVQNRLRNAAFADVMQRGGRADEENIRRGQAVFVGFLHQCAQQNVGGGLDVQHVQAAFSVAELHNMAQYVDHRGVTNSIEFKKYYEAKRALMEGQDLLTLCAEYCFTPNEALLKQGDNLFNAELLPDQITQIRVFKNYTKPEQTALIWDGNNEGKIKAIPSKSSKLLVVEPPLLDKDGQPYKNLYVAGIDSIDVGANESATDYDVSDFCIVIKKRMFGMEPPKYVAMYKDRPNDIREAYEMARKLLT